ncbi:hypothetical protein HK097_010667 [Rhizophlyctis rosea]|uniref:Chromo domain-containing protein n=1 Tax=Rhizophlyctis rosea TaxID=64517 RepID=A0AAD5X3Y3_9FUNG|nr:hypothetical protein HK097_010667 [Rhizophlyctis rosea]
MSTILNTQKLPRKRKRKTLTGTYNVDAILNCRLAEDGEKEYLVKWEGYDLAEATWEPVCNLAAVLWLIDRYHAAELLNQSGLSAQSSAKSPTSIHPTPSPTSQVQQYATDSASANATHHPHPRKRPRHASLPLEKSHGPGTFGKGTKRHSTSTQTAHHKSSTSAEKSGRLTTHARVEESTKRKHNDKRKNRSKQSLAGHGICISDTATDSGAVHRSEVVQSYPLVDCEQVFAPPPEGSNPATGKHTPNKPVQSTAASRETASASPHDITFYLYGLQCPDTGTENTDSVPVTASSLTKVTASPKNRAVANPLSKKHVDVAVKCQQERRTLVKAVNGATKVHIDLIGSEETIVASAGTTAVRRSDGEVSHALAESRDTCIRASVIVQGEVMDMAVVPESLPPRYTQPEPTNVSNPIPIRILPFDEDPDNVGPVESILGRRMVDGKLRYLLKWEDSHNLEWVAAEDMEDCEDLIAEWEAANRQTSGLSQIRPVVSSASEFVSPEQRRIATVNNTGSSRAIVANDGEAEPHPRSAASSPASAPEYEVKCILDKCLTEEGVERYLVWWQGYPIEESTWEKEVNLHDAKEALEEFRNLKRIPPVLHKFMGIYRESNSERLSWPTATFTEARIPDPTFPGAFFVTKHSAHPLTRERTTMRWHIRPSTLANAGLGLFARDAIKAGTFLGVYEGNREKKATLPRLKGSKKSVVRKQSTGPQKHDRIFKIPTGGSLVPVRENMLQFMNTGGVKVEGKGFWKNPHMNNAMWLFDGSYGWVPTCYAIKDIGVGEELFADYGDMFPLQ